MIDAEGSVAVQPRLVSLAEAARAIGRTTSAIEYRIAKGELRAQRVPHGRATRRTLIDLRDLGALTWTKRAHSADPDGARRRSRLPLVVNVPIGPEPGSMPDLNDGNCHRSDAPDFFSEDPNEMLAARALCTDCPVLDSCRAWAIHREPHGVWGGLTSRERIVLRRRAGIKGWGG